MSRHIVPALLVSTLGTVSASAGPLSLSADQYGIVRTVPSPSFTAAAQPSAPVASTRYAYSEGRNLGGGFIEFLFGGGDGGSAIPDARVRLVPDSQAERTAPQEWASQGYLRWDPADRSEPARPGPDPKYLRHEIDYSGQETAGTIVINTRERFLYLVQEGGRALRYGIGVGRPGFAWAGAHHISDKREWPDWTPPDEMLKRRPDLPHFMAGGPDNPLGARAMYLGSTLYRIHGSNEPWTIGQAVSSGCIRMRNEDIIDLYARVKVGTKVVVI
jgi:lipoprotein-anchoring transpeptidase ErfK/SrfK